MDDKNGEKGSIIISVFCLAIFLVGTIIAWVSKNDTLLQLVIGAIVVNATSIVNFWIGSSRSSVKKSETIADIATSKEKQTNG